MSNSILVSKRGRQGPEAVEAGTVRLVGTDAQRILSESHRLLDDRDAYDAMARALNPYGDGLAAQRIVRAIHSYQTRRAN